MTRDQPLPDSKSFFNQNVRRGNPFRFLVFSQANTSWVQCDCKFTCDAVDRSHIPCLFPQKMHFAGILPHSLGSPFSGNPRLAFRSDCEFTCDAPNCSLIPNIFPRKTHQEGFLGVVTAIAKFHSHPSQEESQILTKEHCTGDVWLFDSQFHKPRVALVRTGIGHVTHNSSKRMTHRKVGMSKVACHRMLVGGLDAVRRANAEIR